MHEHSVLKIDELTRRLERLETELTATREQAKAASADRTRFIAAASHDLLQPLNAARLYTSTLVERATDTPLAQLARGIEASLNTVEEIMTALLDLSRLDSGVVEPSPAAFPVQELLDKVAVEFGPLAREKSIRLRLVPSTAVALSDRVLVGRIVQNFVSNAIKYSPEGGHVLVGARRRGKGIRLDVVDAGIGIPSAQHELIFSEFTRLDRAARIAPGLGLGLSIVKRLAKALDLHLELESEPGRGSRFSLALPTADTLAPSIPVPEAVASGAFDMRILCIDNEPEILSGMSALLGGWGCEVRAETSLRSLSGQHYVGWLPDLILMDFHLEQASGLDAIEWLHQNLGSYIPAALLTADHSENVRKLAAARGIPILHKPVKPAALRALIASFAAQRQRSRSGLPAEPVPASSPG